MHEETNEFKRYIPMFVFHNQEIKCVDENGEELMPSGAELYHNVFHPLIKNQEIKFVDENGEEIIPSEGERFMQFISYGKTTFIRKNKKYYFHESDKLKQNELIPSIKTNKDYPSFWFLQDLPSKFMDENGEEITLSDEKFMQFNEIEKKIFFKKRSDENVLLIIVDKNLEKFIPSIEEFISLSDYDKKKFLNKYVRDLKIIIMENHLLEENELISQQCEFGSEKFLNLYIKEVFMKNIHRVQIHYNDTENNLKGYLIDCKTELLLKNHSHLYNLYENCVFVYFTMKNNVKGNFF